MRRIAGVLCLLLVVAAALPGGAAAEQASEPTSAAAGGLDAGRDHSCATLLDARVRCWGFSGNGQLGYGNTTTIGDDETPGSVGPVELGSKRTATAITAGEAHTCAVLDGGEVRCWGYSATGQVGYANTLTIGDNETPAAAGPVNLGGSAATITAGRFHTCAVLDGGDVRCWGFAANGRLGYPDTVNTPPKPEDIGDTEHPSLVGPVFLGTGRTATAITAGEGHTCAVLNGGPNGGDVRCWGYGGNGQLGYPDPAPVPGKIPTPPNIGDNETPGSVGPVNLGTGRTATAIAAGDYHTCAVLNGGDVRCWGFGARGALGYANVESIGDDETPDTVAPVNVGGPAKAITAGGAHTCALLVDGSVRCWGYGFFGQLGYAHTNAVGDDEAPAAAGPVNLGSGRRAVAISAGGSHTCARLDDGSVRCWGYGANGRLGRGVCNEYNVGDDEKPDWVAPLELQTAGPDCAPAGPGPGPGPAPPATGGGQSAAGPAAAPTAPPTAPGGGPGRITGLKARAVSRSKVVLTFRAPESNGANSPAATTYLVKQARRPIRGARRFRRAQTLCRGRCQFSPPRVGARIKLTITDLRPRTAYYYAVAARDTTTNTLGPRSRTVKAKTTH